MICLTDKAKRQLSEVLSTAVPIIFAFIFVAYAISLVIAVVGTCEVYSGTVDIASSDVWVYSCIVQLLIIALLIQQFIKWLYNAFEKCEARKEIQ